MGGAATVILNAAHQKRQMKQQWSTRSKEVRRGELQVPGWQELAEDRLKWRKISKGIKIWR
jgi:hypothetical protein